MSVARLLAEKVPFDTSEAKVPTPVLVREPEVTVWAKRLVEEAVVAKLFVVVALVEVELSAVKFWRVEEAFTRRLVKVPKPEEVMFPALRIEAKRFVEEAVVEKSVVVVALVVVELRAVKFWSVEEPLESRVPKVPRPVVVIVLPPSERAPVKVAAPVERVVAKRFVEEAVVAKKEVVVAEVPVALVKFVPSPST